MGGEEAARLSGADDFLRSLPKGHDTQLGRWFAGGEELSVGQWQKIALARAFFRDASLVVLDEPTSALDPLAEASLVGSFRELLQGRSTILVSHRFSTVRLADRIYVLREGRVVEQGTHSELLRLDGHYAHLYRTQAERYVDGPTTSGIGPTPDN
jgi:ATP-binding cassette, subfamily B, bacterial